MTSIYAANRKGANARLIRTLSLADDKPVLSWYVSNYASLTDKCFTLSYKSPVYMHISRKLFRFTSLK